jgi:hypothetical protein
VAVVVVVGVVVVDVLVLLVVVDVLDVLDVLVLLVVLVVDDAVVVVVAVLAAHVDTLTTLSSRVTAPFRARTRPFTVAPVLRVAELSAMIVPLMALVVPSVAELPTCQKILQACAPFSKTTLLLEAVVSVEPAWKMKTALASPPPFKVSVPVRAMLVEDA